MKMDKDRYSRQIKYKHIGEAGQQKLADSRVTVLGAGGLGSGITELLARAGVGYIRIADQDKVENSNLPRQLMYDEADAAAGRYKAEASAAHIREINSQITVEPIVTHIDETNIDDLIKDADLVIDGADNFKLRDVLNEAAVRLGIPWIYGGVLGTTGASMNILPGGPCLRCIQPKVPEEGTYPTTLEYGVLGVITATIGALEVTQAIKILTKSEDLRHDYISIDLWTQTYDVIQVEKNPNCPICGRSFA
jgi:adenylyltransferase/sulfurtransferase